MPISVCLVVFIIRSMRAGHGQGPACKITSFSRQSKEIYNKSGIEDFIQSFFCVCESFLPKSRERLLYQHYMLLIWKKSTMVAEQKWRYGCFCCHCPWSTYHWWLTLSVQWHWTMHIHTFFIINIKIRSFQDYRVCIQVFNWFKLFRPNPNSNLSWHNFNNV